jgi:hypothetical protein
VRKCPDRSWLEQAKDFAQYKSLRFERPGSGILEIRMGEEGRLATAGHDMHRELAEVWRDVDADPETRVAIIRGVGKGFSAGGDLALVQDIADDFEARARVWREARDMIHNGLTPKITVDPETYQVKADGKLITCEPAKILPMAQRYFLF